MTSNSPIASNSLTIIDNRTGISYEVPIVDGAIRASELRKIKRDEADFGLMSYDPGFTNTATARSAITFVDGEKGILRYRGYPIEELAEKSSYLETAYLILFGELPTQAQLGKWTEDVNSHVMIHTNIQNLIETFRYDAHPMSIFISAVAALATLYPESRDVTDPEIRRMQAERMIAKTPTIAAYIYRHKMGWPIRFPDDELSFVGNFLKSMFQMHGSHYEPNPILEKAINVLFILHADHEQNCGTTAMRTIGSAHADPYTALAGAAAALYGPLHGNANEAVMRQLEEIGTPSQVRPFVEKVKLGQCKLMGFGHRVYKNYDPRCKIIKKTAEEVLSVTGGVTGGNKLFDVALELERIALEDDYFISRKLYPNVDFYSGLVYSAMGLPYSMFSVMFAIPRTCGWVAHWMEMLEDPEQKLARPRQIYTGAAKRQYVPLAKR
ncbi:MAG TPA: citrate synthase [Spirochaetales bacterium]|nr:citrate synthase [Spirochaetales bacterium]